MWVFSSVWPVSLKRLTSVAFLTDGLAVSLMWVFSSMWPVSVMCLTSVVFLIDEGFLLDVASFSNVSLVSSFSLVACLTDMGFLLDVASFSNVSH